MIPSFKSTAPQIPIKGRVELRLRCNLGLGSAPRPTSSKHPLWKEVGLSLLARGQNPSDVGEFWCIVAAAELKHSFIHHLAIWNDLFGVLDRGRGFGHTRVIEDLKGTSTYSRLLGTRPGSYWGGERHGRECIVFKSPSSILSLAS